MLKIRSSEQKKRHSKINNYNEKFECSEINGWYGTERTSVHYETFAHTIQSLPSFRFTPNILHEHVQRLCVDHLFTIRWTRLCICVRVRGACEYKRRCQNTERGRKSEQQTASGCTDKANIYIGIHMHGNAALNAEFFVWLWPYYEHKHKCVLT